jgi:hypothetical protein
MIPQRFLIFKNRDAPGRLRTACKTGLSEPEVRADRVDDFSYRDFPLSTISAVRRMSGIKSGLMEKGRYGDSTPVEGGAVRIVEGVLAKQAFGQSKSGGRD